MDSVFQALLSWQFVLWCLMVSAMIFFVRTIVEYFCAKCVASKWWNDLFLPLMPLILGSVTALIVRKFPYPDGLVSGGGRFVFGLVAGFLSAFVYRALKTFLLPKDSA